MTLKFLQQLVDNPDRGPGRVFAWFIHVVIIVSILVFTLETVPSISPELRTMLWIMEVVCIAIFSVEFLLRIAFSKKGIRYAFTFFGLVDLLAILPFYLALGIDLRGIRAFRLPRLFCQFKFARLQ